MMADLSTYISQRWLRMLPLAVHPNHLTALNHAVVWLSLALTYWSISIERDVQQFVLLVCVAVLVYMSTVLDCLDGMWARASKRTTKVGEFLDHFLDAMHTVLLIGVVGVAFDFPSWMLATNMLLITLTYHIEILTLYESGTFTPIAGVEGQLFLAAMVLLRAFGMLCQVPNHIIYWIGVGSSCIGSVGALLDAYKLLQSTSPTSFMIGRLVHFILHHSVLMHLFLTGNIDRFSFIIAFACLNLVQTGFFVGKHVLNQVHDAHPAVLTRWFVVLAIKSILEPGEVWSYFWIWLPISYLASLAIHFAYTTCQTLQTREAAAAAAAAVATAKLDTSN